MPVKTDPAGFKLAGAVIIGGAVLIVLFMTVLPLISYMRQSKWVETDCRIAVSEVVLREAGRDSNTRVKIIYTYSFDGQIYSCEQINSLHGSNYWTSAENAEVVLGRFPYGSKGKCYVNPDNPAKAVLERSIDSKGLLTSSGLGLLLAAGGIGIVIRGMLMKPAEKRTH